MCEGIFDMAWSKNKKKCHTSTRLFVWGYPSPYSG